MKKQRKMASTNPLPEEVLVEILLRLPVKSIVKFRCNSKSWCALLKSSYFIDTHLKFSQGRKEENVLIKGYCGHPRTRTRTRDAISVHSVDESLSVLIPNLELGVKRYSHSSGHVNFAGSCNGIVCISLNFDIILLCPAIHEFRILPPLPGDPERSDAVLGFGFDPVSNDYKVICNIVEYDAADDYMHCKAILIYNLSTDTWRLKDDVLPEATPAFGGSKLFFNGRVHWWGITGKNIFSMDISTEEVQILGMSKEIEPVIPYSYTRLHVIQDCLAVITHEDNHYLRPSTIHIWLMKEYGVNNSWSKCYKVGPLNARIFPISTIWNNEHLLLGVQPAGVQLGTRMCWSAWDDGPPVQLVVWDLLKNEQVHEYTHFKGFGLSIDALFYKESLISIARSKRD